MRNIIFKYGFFILAATLFFPPKAEAKRFIGRSVTVNLTYSNVLTGTETVIERKAVEVRYSDNDQNCLVFKNGQYTPQMNSACVSDLQSYYVDIDIPVAAVQFWLNDSIPARLMPSWTRILAKYKALEIQPYREKPGTFQFQLHDSVANESFHVTITVEAEKPL